MRTCYESLPARDIDAGRYGIRYLDAEYPAESPMETKPELFLGQDGSESS